MDSAEGYRASKEADSTSSFDILSNRSVEVSTRILSLRTSKD